jgi:hypothetical protein
MFIFITDQELFAHNLKNHIVGGDHSLRRKDTVKFFYCFMIIFLIIYIFKHFFIVITT